jgi:hypothetical protein
MNKTLSGTLASAVANAGTFTVSYPALTAPEFPGGVTDASYFYRARGHTIVVNGAKYTNPNQFSVTLGTTNITITNRTGATWPAGSPFTLELQEAGKNVYVDQGLSGTGNKVARMYRADAFRVNLGSPDTAAATGVATAQLLGAAGNLTLDGATVQSGVAILDVPRNFTLTVATTNQSAITFTVRGFDEYGNAMTETIAGPNANTVQGKKAFKRITQVAASAAIATNGVSVGFGDVLGLPVYLPSAGWILKELQDGAAATAGTPVAGDVTAGGPTGTTGDVRGTYDPNAAADGAKVFELIVCLAEPGDLGMPQFAG